MDSKPTEPDRGRSTLARRLTALALSFVAPPRCGICGGPCEASEAACGVCVAILKRRPALERCVPGLGEVFSALAYEDEARRLITGLKFHRLVPLARVAAEVIAAKAPARLLAHASQPEPGYGLDVHRHPVRMPIVPVPPSPARLRSRGLDPADEIASALGALTGSRVERCLGREEAVRQVGRARRERLEDPPRFFALTEPPPFALLVDDVLTTGATLGACAGALRSSGCRHVSGVTFACAERRVPRS